MQTYFKKHDQGEAEYAEIVHRSNCLPYVVVGVIADPHSNFCEHENDIDNDEGDARS